jgi:hypothetical protein
LIVPGLRDHVEDHWQTILARKLPNARVVPPLEYDKPSCAAKIEALNQALCGLTGPVVLVSHSAGVIRGNRPFRAISGGHRPHSPVQQGSPVLQHFLETRIHQASDK